MVFSTTISSFNSTKHRDMLGLVMMVLRKISEVESWGKLTFRKGNKLEFLGTILR